MNEEELYQKLRSAGLERVAKRIAWIGEPCLCLRRTVTPEDSIPVGTSKLGGRPDLPAGVDWPEWNGRPLSFLGQINLSDTSEYDSCKALPQSGLLWFFYDCEQETWGFDPKDKGSWRVLFYDGQQEDLSRRPFPDEIPEYAQYHACSVTFHEALSVPGMQSLYIDQLQLDDTEFDRYEAFLDSLAADNDDQPVHQLLGHPSEVQGDMHLECQLVSHGLYCGDETGYTDPQSAELESGALEWKLLFQLDTDDDPNMMWGDMGMLYFWIQEHDLEAREFDKVWMILQCG
jgi:uncharacterized protein YwqG